MMIQYPWPPSALPVENILLYDRWNSDEILKCTLAQMKEPMELDEMQRDSQLRKANLRMMKIRVRELEQLKLAIAPRRSYDIESNIALLQFSRKMTAWRTFPLCELPVEILSKIFHLSVWSQAPGDEQNMQRLRLTWICRHIRAVAIEDKALWANVWFQDIYPWTRSLAFIERAGDAPLTLRINDREWQEGDEEGPVRITPVQMRWLLDIVLRKIATIRALIIAVKQWDPMIVAVEKFAQAGIPSSMERIELHRTGAPYFWNTNRRRNPPRPPLVLGHAPMPRLKWLVLDGVPVQWQHLPYRNLTTLDLRRISSADAPDVAMWTEMLDNPRMFSLVLDSGGPRMGDDADDPATRDLSAIRTVTLPNLRELAMSNMTLRYALYCLSFVHAPGLRSLILTSLHGDDFAPLFGALTGKFPEVRLLTMQNTECALTDYNVGITCKWLGSMPHLRMLKFQHLPEALINALIDDDRQYYDKDTNKQDSEDDAESYHFRLVCQELEYLLVQGSRADPLKDLLDTRKALGPMIKRVYATIDFIRTCEIDQVKAIRELTGDLFIFSVGQTPAEYELHQEMIASLNEAP